MHFPSVTQQLCLRISVTLLVSTWVITAALGLLQIWMPINYQTFWGVNYAGVEHFVNFWNLSVAPLSSEAYSFAYRLLFSISIVLYVCLIFLVSTVEIPSNFKIQWTLWFYVIFISLMTPSGLSNDVYAYVAYAKMVIFHDINPHSTSAFELARLGDPVAPFLSWDTPTPYGAVWTFISILLVGLTGWAPLEFQIFAFKVLSGISLIFLAHGAKKAATSFGRQGDVAYVATIACPLFILEGPITGHNDVLMMAFFVWSIALLRIKKIYLSGIFFAISVGIKLVPIIALPWILKMSISINRAPLRTVLAQLLILLSVALLPTIFFISDLSVLGGGSGRSVRIASSFFVLLLFYGFVTVWVFRAPESRWHLGWVLVTMVLILLIGPPFPWYFIWPLCIALLGGGLTRNMMIMLLMFFAYLASLGYVLTPPPSPL